MTVLAIVDNWELPGMARLLLRVLKELAWKSKVLKTKSLKNQLPYQRLKSGQFIIVFLKRAKDYLKKLLICPPNI